MGFTSAVEAEERFSSLCVARVSDAHSSMQILVPIESTPASSRHALLLDINDAIDEELWDPCANGRRTGSDGRLKLLVTDSATLKNMLGRCSRPTPSPETSNGPCSAAIGGLDEDIVRSIPSDTFCGVPQDSDVGLGYLSQSG